MLRKLAIAAETLLIVALIAGAKALVHNQGWEVIQLNALFTSIIAGGVFIISMILAGTLGDFKECEKVPAEFVAALESIYEEGVRVRALCPSFDLAALREALAAIVAGFHADLADPPRARRDCLQAINALCAHFTAMEACGLAPNYIVRLKTEQGALRKLILRVYHIQYTGFVPSAYVLIDGLLCLIIGLLLFAEIEHFWTALIQIAFISYLFIYMVKLLRALDTPFRVTERTRDDVSRFLLKEFAARLEAERAEHEQPCGK